MPPMFRRRKRLIRPRVTVSLKIKGIEKYGILSLGPFVFPSVTRPSRKVVNAIVKLSRLVWGSKELGGTRKQIRSMLVNFPRWQIGGYHKGKLVGVLLAVPGESRGWRDVPVSHRKVTNDLQGRKPRKGDNAIYFVSVSANQRLKSVKHVGVRLVGFGVLGAYAAGIEHIFAYTAPRSFSEARKKKPGLTLEKHFKSGKDVILHKFHAREFEHKPKGTLVKLLKEARPEDHMAGGACALVQYKKKDIEAWIRRNQAAIGPWLKHYGIVVEKGVITRLGKAA